MLTWLCRRREKAKRIETIAEALVKDFGVGAYAEARKREREAPDLVDARNWNRVAATIARITRKRLGFDTTTRMATDADFIALLKAFDVQTPLSNETVNRCHDGSERSKRPVGPSSASESGVRAQE